MTVTPITPTHPDALAKLAEIPPAGSEERDLWLEAAEQHGFDLHCDGSFYTAEQNEVLTLMSEARKQGQQDVLDAAPDYSRDFQLMLARLIHRHGQGRPLTETIAQARDLLARKGTLSFLREDAALATGGARHG